jgi:hypothetical protein
MKRILLFSILIVLSLSCRKFQPEINDPHNACDCSQEVSADFLMEEGSGNPNLPLSFYTNTDTTRQGKNVRFTAIEKNAQVTWYLGQETFTNVQSVKRYFGANFAGQSLPIICVVKKEPNLICFPNDDGYDSIVKYIHVSNHDVADSSYLLEGTFRVKEKNSADSIDLTVDFRELNGLVIDLYNYDGQGNDNLNNWTSLNLNYREIRFPINAHYVKILHKLSGEVKIEIVANSATFSSFYYTGRQL